MKRMMEAILRLYDGAKGLIAKSIPLSQIKATGIFDQLIQHEISDSQRPIFHSLTSTTRFE